MGEGLQVRDLVVNYHTDDGVVAAVDRASFDVPPGRRLGLVGESGSGKTTTALALIQMLRAPGRVDGGTAMVGSTDLLALTPPQMREARLQDRQLHPAGRDELAEPGAHRRPADGERALRP